ncbi:helix-turn-helix domain-containing protein [Paraglaciecola hydrolytica]|uniref:MerR family transcriptional regulator n=1 Tax=Paraglaciecola hydrolytica TaxID=1799789 RepID=A0A136A5T5_9ALTE|nr:helix-turn-helix domain-containing protein [Paraglaciecola hydrolytica]KXI30608.1 MerR family transcriptional regulator [Paraglaciecola hydrolytica]
MKAQNELDIAQVSKLSGMPASTLRYYEERALIKSIGREGLKRIFPLSVIDQLALISLGRYAGFSLDEIAMMFSPNGRAKLDRAQLLEKADELTNTIQQLTAMRDGIVHVANCPKTNQLDCPRFQTLVKSAARKQLMEKRVRKTSHHQK